MPGAASASVKGRIHGGDRRRNCLSVAKLWTRTVCDFVHDVEFGFAVGSPGAGGIKRLIDADFAVVVGALLLAHNSVVLVVVVLDQLVVVE